MIANEKQMKKTQFKGVLMLLLTALIWGAAFVAQSVGMENVGAFTFNGIRMLLGAVVLLPFILIRDRIVIKNLSSDQLKAKQATDKRTILYGLILGIVFCAASNFQQFAFYYSTAGKIAFITALYIFFVPLLGLFLKKRVSLLTWLCVLIGFIGLYFLCINPNDVKAINKGDLLALICSLLFAIHILMVEKFSPKVDGLKLSCTQFAVSGILSCILMQLFETPTVSAVKGATLPLLYSGILSCGLAYTLQIVGQKYTEATVASLLLCMESVFAVLSASLLLHEMLTGREILGCCIMFAAIIFSQFSELLATKKST